MDDSSSRPFGKTSTENRGEEIRSAADCAAPSQWNSTGGIHRRLFGRGHWLIVLASGMLAVVGDNTSWGQDPSGTPPATPPVASSEKDQAGVTPGSGSNSTSGTSEQATSAAGDFERDREELKTLFEEWREFLREGFESLQRYENGSREDSVAEKKKWESAYDRAQVKKKAIDEKLHEMTRYPLIQADAELRGLWTRLLSEYYKTQRLERLYQLSKKLLADDPNQQGLLLAWGLSSILSNRFDEAQEFRRLHGGMIGDFASSRVQLLFDQLDKLQTRFQSEAEIRAAETAADDLPRVLFRTTRGSFVVELYENQAPNSVANFIFLAEKGFYNNTVFHRVIDEFVAQGGDPLGNGTGGPGYYISDEFGKKTDRPHFAYVLSMAKSERPNTAGSQFFITLAPMLELDGKHAVFGRVIDGFDVIDSLTRTFTNSEGAENPIKGAVPDKILTTEVVRKRPHPYLPERLSIAGEALPPLTEKKQ